VNRRRTRHGRAAIRQLGQFPGGRAVIELGLLAVVGVVVFAVVMILATLLKLALWLLLLPLRLLLLPLLLLLKGLIGGLLFVVLGPILLVAFAIAAIVAVVAVAVPLLPLLLVAFVVWLLLRATATTTAIAR
jgi:hypothetical protein